MYIYVCIMYLLTLFFSQNVPQYKPEPKTPKGILAEKNTDPYQGFYRNLRKDVTSV